jgi:hypothetical protein
MDPDREEERERKITWLRDCPVRIARVQLGIHHTAAGGPAFSCEWERDCVEGDVAWMWLYYDRKVIRVEVRAFFMSNL